MIKTFRRLEKTSKNSRIARESTCFAGRAGLALYHRSRRSEDLAKAIGHFRKYNRVSLSKGLLKLPSGKGKPGLSAKSRVWPGGSGASSRPGIDRPRGAATAYGKLLPTRSRPQCIFHWTGNPFVARKPSAEHASMSGPENTGSRVKQDATNKKAGLGPTPSPLGKSQPKSNIRPVSKGILVVLDPGHGGKDPGAVSRDGKLKEKDITLKIAKRIKKLLDTRNPRIRTVMTRTDDTFLSLEERTALANSLDADLFISIHCNASTEAASRGVETYFLSTAGSRRAMQVAARENGIPLQKLNDIQTTLLDLMVTSKTSQSQKLATTVHSALTKTIGLRRGSVNDRGVRKAPFYVLLGAKMPSILVECLFISNPREARRLQNPAYLNLVAKGIVSGAHAYLQGNGERAPGLAIVSNPGTRTAGP